MKNLFNFLVILILSISILEITGCSKSSNSSTPATTTTTPLISKSIAVSAPNTQGISVKDTVKYTYNTAGKLIKSTSSKDTSYVTYDYSGSTVTEKHFDKNNNLVDRLDYNLSTKSLATAATEIKSLKTAKGTYSSKNPYVTESTTTNHTYTYDSNDFMTKEVASNSTLTVTLDHSISTDGNETNESEADEEGSSVLNISNNMTYLTTKTNTLAKANMGISFLGKSSKNLLSTKVVQNGTTTATTNFTYEYDTKNRVTKKTETTGTSVAYTLFEYTN